MITLKPIPISLLAFAYLLRAAVDSIYPYPRQPALFLEHFSEFRKESLATPAGWFKHYHLTRKRYAAAVHRQAAAYEKRWTQTSNLETPPPLFDPNREPRMTVVFTAGLYDETGTHSDFHPIVMKRFGILRAELIDRFPFTELAVYPLGRLHLNLFVPFLLKPYDFLEYSSAELRQEAYSSLVKSWKNLGPIDLVLRGINMMPNGDLIIEGHVVDDRIERIRQKLTLLYHRFDPTIRPMGLFSSITLMRSSARDWSEFATLRSWVAKNRKRYFGRISIRRPILFAEADFRGWVYHNAAQNELIPFNRQLLSSC